MCEEEIGGLTIKTKQTKHVMVTIGYSISTHCSVFTRMVYRFAQLQVTKRIIADRIACDLFKQYIVRTYTYDPTHAQCDIAVFFHLNIFNSNLLQSMSYDYYCH